METNDWDDSPVATIFDSLEKMKSDLPAEITHEFEEIRKKLNEDKFQSWWLFPTSDSIFLLDHLNDVLAECHILKLQRTSIKKKTSPFFLYSHRIITKRIISALQSIHDQIKPPGESKANGNSSPWSPTNFWTRQSTPGYKPDRINFRVYHEDEQKIVDRICGEGFKAVGICGMCGSGKTVLVDKVLKSPKVQDMFSPIVKICLSDMSPKEQGDTKIVKHLLEVMDYDVDRLTGKRRDADPVDELKQRLLGKKFLIVLDDVWFCNDWFIINPDNVNNGDGNLFTHALPKDTGGAVVVTSRRKDVAQKIVGDEFLFHLKPWDGKANCLEDWIRELFSHHPKVEELVCHLHGLPLAAKTLIFHD